MITAAVPNEVYYIKHTGTGALNAQECAVQYMDVQYGVVKVSDDGMSCDHETWSWFDTHSPDAGHTYYVKDKMKISFNPPVILFILLKLYCLFNRNLNCIINDAKRV